MCIKDIPSIIEEYKSKTSAPLGVAFMDMKSGFSVMNEPDRRFPLASVFKVFILIEAFRKRAAGELSFDERITVTADQLREGSGILKNFHPGFTLSFYDFIYLMMSYSDNTATDVVISRVCLEDVRNDVVKRFGFDSTRIDYTSKEMLNAAYSAPAPDGEMMKDGSRASYRFGPYFDCTSEKNLDSTPSDVLKVLRMLYESGFMAKEDTAELLDVMKKCAINNRIPAKLPHEAVVAHKTGSLDRVVNDAGLVYAPNGTYALAAFYNGNLADYDEYCANDNYSSGIRLISSLSSDIYNAYVH